MKRFKVQKAYQLFMFIMSVSIILPGCSGGVFGGGSWDKPSVVAVSSTNPANNSTSVPTNTTAITAIFTGAMNPATFSTTTFTLMQGATIVPGTVTFSGVTAVFAPANVLLPTKVYTATITTGVKNTAGNALANNYVWNFITGENPDIIKPTVSVTSPTNGALDVPFNRIVTIGFSEAMDPATINKISFAVRNTDANTAVDGAVIPVGTSATFSPAIALSANTNYLVTIKSGIGGVGDLAGNAMLTDFVFTFTTSSALDTTKPTVIATINNNGATNVPTNSKVGATFSEVMNPLTITSATFTFTEKSTPLVPVLGNVSYTGVNAVFAPTVDLKPSTEYTATITIGATDLAGNPLATNYVWSWTTAATKDLTRPTVILVVPADALTNVAIDSAVYATFDKAMDSATISTATFTLQKTGSPLGPQLTGTVNYDAITKVATFTPSSVLDTSTKYTATVTNAAADLAANTLLVNKVWSFTTAAVVVPPIVPPASHLGSAATYGIMATSAITNTGATTKINGDVALEPGTSNGLLPAQVNGAIHVNDSVSHQAYADLLVAYNYYKTLPRGTTITAGADLGALYPGGIPPGTYTSDSTMAINTHLTLDGGGNANAVWVFQIGSSITTTTPLGTISLINGANANNVFWVPTASATIGVGTTFYGNVIAGVSITGQTGALINGRLLAGAIGAGTIALDTNIVNVPAP